jgi:hypothetical protein
MDNAGGTASLEALTMLTLKAAVISIEAPGGIQLKTTGIPQGGLVLIDGSLYSVHVHTDPVSVTTGPLLI